MSKQSQQLKVSDWPIEKLIPYGKNPRKNDEQVDRMCSAIQEFGFRIPIIAKSDGTVVDGHLRLKAAKKLGLKSVPVALADELSDAQVKAFRLLANKSANWADWDVIALADEFSAIADMGFDLELTGFADAEISDVFDASAIEFSNVDVQGLDSKSLGRGQTRVKVCMDKGCIDVLEKAIAKTGEPNRMKAIRKICEAYLEKR